MKILGIDIETGSSFNTPKEKTIVTEIGAVLWDTELGCPVAMESMFVNEGEGVHLEAAEYTGISTDMIEEFGVSPDTASKVIYNLVQKADRICGHNGNKFDKPVLDGMFKRYMFGPMPGVWSSKNWIDTQTDIDYPSTMRSRNLIYLSACHGFVNPFQHRAVTDSLSMLRILGCYDISKVIENADSPKVRVLANVSFEQKHKAKDAGFYWDSDRKVWFRKMRKNQVEQFLKTIKFPFKVVEL